MGPKTPQSQEKRKRNVLTLSKRSAPAAISSPDEPSPMEDDSSPKASCSGVSHTLSLSDSEDSD